MVESCWPVWLKAEARAHSASSDRSHVTTSHAGVMGHIGMNVVQ